MRPGGRLGWTHERLESGVRSFPAGRVLLAITPDTPPSSWTSWAWT